jgi:hypothetical protein
MKNPETRATLGTQHWRKIYKAKNKTNENTTQKTEKTKSTTTKTGDEPKDDQRRQLQKPGINLKMTNVDHYKNRGWT